MKYSVLIGMIVLLAWGCSPSKKAAKGPVELTNGADSTEYGIIILDPQFDQWYIMNYTPAKDYTNEYYRAKNRNAVTNWNNYYNTGRYKKIIDSYIDYRPDTDYGIEVNRKLYWYMTYISDNYGIRLFY